MKWTIRILQGLLAAAFLMFGILKLAVHPIQVEAFTTTYGYGLSFMYVVGAIELLAGVGLVVGYWKQHIAFFYAGIIACYHGGRHADPYPL